MNKPLAFCGDTDFYGTLDEMKQLIADLEQVVNFDVFNIDIDKNDVVTAVTIKDMGALSEMFKLIRHLPFAFQAFLLGGQHGNLEAFSTMIRQLYDASLNMFATVVDYHRGE